MSPELPDRVCKAREVSFLNREGGQLRPLCTKHQNDGAHVKTEEMSEDAPSVAYLVALLQTTKQRRDIV